MSKIDKLPDEVILGIIGRLRSVQDLKSLQLVSRHFHKLARDGFVWRLLCFESSIAGRRHNRATIPKTIPPRPVQALQAEVAVVQSLQKDMSRVRREVKAEELAKWDPRHRGERVDWFREYIARQAPIHLHWAKGSSKQTEEDVDGVSLYQDSQGARFGFMSFEDRSVGLWDLGAASNDPGRVLRSRSELLNSGYQTTYDGFAEDRIALSSSTASECISVNHDTARAFVAVDSQLNEVDLNTLQLTSCAALPRPISALSNSVPGLPLIVGTSAGLFRYDSRQSFRSSGDDHIHQRTQALQQPLLTHDPQLPLSIVQTHPSASGSHAPEIYAAGRYPSVLIYDQRSFPRVRQSIWSGATFSSLSLVPKLLPQVPLDPPVTARRYGHVYDDQEEGAGRTILAAGSKNGKGSLELYGIDGSSGSVVGNIRNRTMASRVKLLSVAAHGKRICVSDADGNIKWFERDGFNLVRQVNTNDLTAAASSRRSFSSSSSPSSSPPHSSSSAIGSWGAADNGGGGGSGGGIFGVRQDNGDVVQKLVPVGDEENADILVWAGSRAGLVSTTRETPLARDDDEHLDEETARARKYESEMRRLLEAQAVEARRMQDFGM